MDRRGDTRKERVDKKHKYLLSIEQHDFHKIRAIAFNCNISYQKVIEMLLVESLANDFVVDKIYSAYPPVAREQFVIVRGDS